MNFGENWKEFMGECDKSTSFEVLDAFFDLGGNFIDTVRDCSQGSQETVSADDTRLLSGQLISERRVRGVVGRMDGEQKGPRPDGVCHTLYPQAP